MDLLRLQPLKVNTMEEYQVKRIRVESLPKYAPKGADVRTEEYMPKSLQEARDYIGRKQDEHKTASLWYKIYIGDKLEFNSRMIH